MRAEDEDALDVAGAAGAGYERNHARKIRRVFLLQESKRGGQVGHKLFAARDDDVMRWQNGQRASAGAAAGHHHAAGLGDERVAFGDARVALLHFLNVVAPVGERHRQAERFAGEVGQFAAMTGDALPFLRVTQFDERGFQFIAAGEQLKIRFQVGGVFGEQIKLFRHA